MNSFATRCCAEMAGDAKHAARRQILRFITRNFAAGPATIPSRTWLPSVPHATPARISALPWAILHGREPSREQKLDSNSGDRNEAAQLELDRIQIALNRVAESLQATGWCCAPFFPCSGGLSS